MDIISFRDIRELLRHLRNREEAATVCSIAACSLEINACYNFIRANAQHISTMRDMLSLGAKAHSGVAVLPLLLETIHRLESQNQPTFIRLKACLQRYSRLQRAIEVAISQHRSVIEELEEVFAVVVFPFRVDVN